MAELTDIQNEFVRAEIEEYLDRPEEIRRNVELFAKARPKMQEIAERIAAFMNEGGGLITAADLAAYPSNSGVLDLEMDTDPELGAPDAATFAGDNRSFAFDLYRDLASEEEELTDELKKGYQRLRKIIG